MPLENPSYVFGEDCATSLIVKQSSAADHTVLKCGFGEKPVGVAHEGSREAPIPGVTPLCAKSGESARVYGPGESCEVEVGSGVVVTAGRYVMADANSKARRAIHGLPRLGRAEKTVTGPSRARVYVDPGIHDNSDTVINGTQAATTTLNDYDSGATLTNTGASGAATFTLPAAVPGLSFRVRVNAAQELRLDPNGTETIALPSTSVQGGAGKYLSADAVGEGGRIWCDIAGRWETDLNGTWTAEA
jgi:hypothetical protein